MGPSLAYAHGKSYLAQGVFSWQIFLVLGTVVFFVLFGHYCLIMD
jgi:hypothetical protein